VTDSGAEASVTPGRFSDDDVTKWMLQAAKGLDYLHSRASPVVHRDLKLANIMLDDRWAREDNLRR
jgi:serine/threonine protein kinase